MNTSIVTQATGGTLSGSLPFPTVVGMLIEAGVEYYHVDYASHSISYYGAEGERSVAAITFEGLPSIAADLNIAELKAAIIDSQQNGQKYFDFSARAMRAGVQGYYVFLRGQRVTYFGRDGEQFTEWFPGAKPGDR